MAGLYLGGKVVAPVVTKEIPEERFGVNLDTFINKVDENGVLNRTTWKGTLNFVGVTEIGEKALYYMFYGHTGITSVDLSSIQSIGRNGLTHAFYGCTGITNVDLSSLQSVGSDGLSWAFSDCGITTISFPSLTSVQTDSFRTTFQYCGELTEIHFRADMQAMIEAMTGYSSKFGATNATIYFDL